MFVNLSDIRTFYFHKSDSFWFSFFRSDPTFKFNLPTLSRIPSRSSNFSRRSLIFSSFSSSLVFSVEHYQEKNHMINKG